MATTRQKDTETSETSPAPENRQNETSPESESSPAPAEVAPENASPDELAPENASPDELARIEAEVKAAYKASMKQLRDVRKAQLAETDGSQLQNIVAGAISSFIEAVQPYVKNSGKFRLSYSRDNDGNVTVKHSLKPVKNLSAMLAEESATGSANPPEEHVSPAETPAEVS